MAVTTSVVQFLAKPKNRSPLANLEHSFLLRFEGWFGTPIAASQVSITDMREEDAVVNAVADFSDVWYALIEGLQTETGHEGIAIAYSNQESLRYLIAAPSIAAFGFAPRDEAIVDGGASFPNAVVDQRTSETMAGPKTNTPRRLNRQRRGTTGSMSQKVTRFVSTSCSDVLTWAIVTFSSNSLVPTAIRMALGSSV